MDETPFIERKPERLPRQTGIRIGPLAAIVILIAIFATGGIYFFLHEKARLNAPPIQETINA